MIYLIAVFVPPLYFFLKRKWISFLVHSVLYFFAIGFTITMVGAVVGIPLWGISAACAVWDLRKQLMNEQATIMANKMVEAFEKRSGAAPDKSNPE